MKKEEAEKLGAEHEFGVKYPDMVSVYSVGPLGSAFSIEFCGGPHVGNTAELGSIREPDGSVRKAVFKIQKEEAVAAGIRRIKAVLQ
jgi:alanyl-tRNA synthetase